MEKSKGRLSHPTCKSRKERAIRTFPPPLRLLTYETGHFISSQKRTFSLANDTSALAVIRPDANYGCVLGRYFHHSHRKNDIHPSLVAKARMAIKTILWSVCVK